MRIEPLRSLSLEDAQRLIFGYTSAQRYAITKDETHERTTIALDLVDLPEPYEKRFDPPEQMIKWYGGVLADGLSFGSFEDDARLIALTIAQRQWNGIGMVWELHVEEPHRRQGIGRALLEAVEGAARSSGLRAVSIETQQSNVPAITFYRACGYAIGALDLSFYRNDDAERGEAAVFMKKVL